MVFVSACFSDVFLFVIVAVSCPNISVLGTRHNFTYYFKWVDEVFGSSQSIFRIVTFFSLTPCHSICWFVTMHSSKADAAMKQKWIDILSRRCLFFPFLQICTWNRKCKFYFCISFVRRRITITINSRKWRTEQNERESATRQK